MENLPELPKFSAKEKDAKGIPGHADRPRLLLGKRLPPRWSISCYLRASTPEEVVSLVESPGGFLWRIVGESQTEQSVTFAPHNFYGETISAKEGA